MQHLLRLVVLVALDKLAVLLMSYSSENNITSFERSTRVNKRPYAAVRVQCFHRSTCLITTVIIS